jgi:hypothetical protein
MSRLAAGLAAVLALGLAAPAALGATPERYTDTFVNEDTIDCSRFNPAWTFHDDFVDFFEIRGQLTRDAAGDPVSAIEHVHHVSNDVNSVTGFTLHEHNHFTVKLDFVHGTVSLSGAINVMQRRGVGSVIQFTGHKVVPFDDGEPLKLAGPEHAEDIDFCRAVAPVGTRR